MSVGVLNIVKLFFDEKGIFVYKMVGGYIIKFGGFLFKWWFFSIYIKIFDKYFF